MVQFVRKLFLYWIGAACASGIVFGSVVGSFYLLSGEMESGLSAVAVGVISMICLINLRKCF